MKLLFAAMSLVCALGFTSLRVSPAAEESVASAPVPAEETSRPDGDVDSSEALAVCPEYYTCFATGRIYSSALLCNRACAPAGCLIDYNCQGSCFCP